jgi:hypothetical protein
MENGATKPRMKWFESKSEGLAWLFGFLSFVADIYTVSQMLNWLPSERPLIPWAGGLIWLLALFTYLALMHDHWEKIGSKPSVSHSFLGYMAGNLILNFSEPWRLIPLVLLLVLLVPVAHSLVLDSCVWAPIGMVGFFMGIWKLTLITSGASRSSTDADELADQTRREIEADWPLWEKRIRVELTDRYGVVWHDFRDMTTVKGYREGVEGKFIFAYYVSKHPRSVRFGTLWKKPTEPGAVREIVALYCLVRLDWLKGQTEYEMD